MKLATITKKVNKKKLLQLNRKVSKRKTVSEQVKKTLTIAKSRVVKKKSVLINGKHTQSAIAKKTAKKTAKKSSLKFKVGDYLVYPMHGVGKISSISKRDILGKSKRYYVLEIDANRMRVYIPTNKIEEVGVRPIITKKEVNKVFRILKKNERDTEEDWKLRYQKNMLKIKSGNIYLVAEVCRNLSKRNQDKELSLMERRLYESAYNLMTSEIAYSANLDKEDAGNMISEMLD